MLLARAVDACQRGGPCTREQQGLLHKRWS